ncbi:MAG: hypothetical protein MJ137_05905 [Clostridia bacterium]|nr:hypothetical protein [Clostridia bacterium]
MNNHNKAFYPSLKRLFAALSLGAAALYAVSAAGCASGRVISKTAEEGLVISASYRDDGISGISVTADGKETFSRKISQASGNRPYTDNDGLDYGLYVGDIDLDGFTDIAVCVSRRDGAEKYAFYFGDGIGGFTELKQLSKLKSPVFGKGDGKISSYSEITEYESRGIPGQPDIYTECHMTEYWGRNGEGKAVKLGASSLTFYSEEDIYCLATYVPDPEKPSELTEDTEIWIHPSVLGDYGLTPFALR